MPAPHHSVFTGGMPFPLPNQQHQSTESMQVTKNFWKKAATEGVASKIALSSGGIWASI